MQSQHKLKWGRTRRTYRPRRSTLFILGFACLGRLRYVNRWLVLTSLGVTITTKLLPSTRLARYLGFTRLPLSPFGLLTLLLF